MKPSQVFSAPLVFAALCVTGPASANALALEAVFATVATEHGLRVRVRSSGCTDKESFALRGVGGSGSQIALVRVRPDRCRAYLPTGVTLEWSWSELGVAPGQAQLTNPTAPLR